MNLWNSKVLKHHENLKASDFFKLTPNCKCYIELFGKEVFDVYDQTQLMMFSQNIESPNANYSFKLVQPH